ncbi:MAG: DedA family protein [Bacillota bacterium]|nr:DedA family protein [Bacillota bacterium]
MQDFIISITNQFGYIGILLLVAIENIFPPIPSEVILTFGGFMTTYTSMNIYLVILSATLGSVLGALILYGIGRWITPQKLSHIIDGRFGRISRIKKSDLNKASAWFASKGNSAVFICRFIPLVRSLISIPAGIAKFDLKKFVLLTAAGTLIWNAVLVSLGAIAGSSWGKIVSYFKIYSILAVALLSIPVVILGVIFYRRRISKHQSVILLKSRKE